MPLVIIAEAENGLAGILAKSLEDTAICIECKLEGWHFEDRELGDFLAWQASHAAPRYMLRRLTGFIVGEGRRRKLDAAFAMAHSHFLNEESPLAVLEDILNAAELAMDDRYDLPKLNDEGICNHLDMLFGRWLADDDPRKIIAEYRRPYANTVEAL